MQAWLLSTYRADRVQGLAVAKRLEILPDLKTSAEGGLPEFLAEGWNAIFTPANTPNDVTARLNGALRTSIADPAVSKRFNELGSTPADESAMTADHVRKVVTSDIARYKVTLAIKD